MSSAMLRSNNAQQRGSTESSLSSPEDAASSPISNSRDDRLDSLATSQGEADSEGDNMMIDHNRKRHRSIESFSSDEDETMGDSNESAKNPNSGPREGRTKIFLGQYEMTRANITQRKITYRCSFYRSQKCRARLEYYSSTMDYDYDTMVPHTCLPPRPVEFTEIASMSSISVISAMKRAVDTLATSTAKSPEQIWETLHAQFYNQDNVVVHGLTKIQVVKRVHRARSSHFGLSIHGRVEVPPLALVKHSTLKFFQFHHIWSNIHSKREDKLDRLIGWAHPELITLLRYDNITLFLDGTFRCTPSGFTQCIVLMVFDRCTKLYVPVFYVLSTSKSYDAYWNAMQYVSDASGESLKPKDIVCDFEKSLVNAVCDRFPSVQVMGCFFFTLSKLAVVT
ncbi:hypothetical protein AeRB84_003342 [Aphanomyces euteiches]|nr:hypothetical protein AeRB84_003342 [Aphanomyces euteiches]